MAADRLQEAIEAVVRGCLPEFDYQALYPAKIVGQSWPFVDVQPDDTRIPAMANVPLVMGLPGASVDGTVGGRVRIGWGGGNPALPYAIGFDADTRAAKIVLTADQIILGGELGAEFGVKGQTLQAYLQSFYTWALTHVHATAALGPPVPGLPPPPTVPPTLLATNTKVL